MSSFSIATRPAAVAGLFYPASPGALREAVRGHLDAPPGAMADPKVLVVPHAGYIYSGATAGRGYATLRGRAAHVRRVVLVGPAHRVAVRGVALPSADAFETPLGVVPVDRSARDALLQMPGVAVSDRAHAGEHALEVQLPFLQEVLGEFSIVPLVVGDARPSDVADVLERVWGDAETLIVVSTDLSHYLPYDRAREVDAGTLKRVLQLDPALDHEHACGATPLNALLHVAQRRGLQPHLVAASNSGDAAGDRDRVVGYAALAFTGAAPVAVAAGERGTVLLAHARRAIEALFAPPGAAPLPEAEFLDVRGATFVTLRRDGELRGCVGTLEPDRALRDDVARNARAAALHDPRFEPLRADELPGLAIEVSLLAPPQPLAFRDEDDLLRQLASRRPGVILEHRQRRATFLPQVWDDLPDPREFLRHLQTKAGVTADVAPSALALWTYEIEKWSER